MVPRQSLSAITRLMAVTGLAIGLETSFQASAVYSGDEPEVGAFSRSYLNPPELQFGCVGTSDSIEERYAEQLRTGAPNEQLVAARALWRGHSRRYAADVLKYLASPTSATVKENTFKRHVDAAVRPEAIIRELKEGDYLWGTWLAFLRPHKQLTPALLSGLSNRRERAETVLALGKCRDARAFDALANLVTDKDSVTAGFAIQALGYLGDAKGEPLLIKAIESDHTWLQVQAGWALAEIGTPKALPALEKLANGRGFTGVLNTRSAARAAIVGIERRHLPRDPVRWPVATEPTPVAILRGHIDHVWAVAFSPDGKTIASAGDSGVRLWDRALAKGTASLHGHARQMMFAAFVSRDILATAGWGNDGSVRLLEIPEGKTKTVLPADRGGISSLVVSRDGKLLAVTGSGSIGENDVQVFDTTTGKCVNRLTKTAFALGFSPDGKLLATGSAKDSADILLWDLEAETITQVLRGHIEVVMTAAFSPDGRVLASGGDWTVRLWDVRSGKGIASFRGDSTIHCVAFSQDGRTVASGEVAGPTRIWDIAAGKAVAVMNGRAPVAYSPDGTLLASGSADGNNILLWKAPKLKWV